MIECMAGSSVDHGMQVMWHRSDGRDRRIIRNEAE